MLGILGFVFVIAAPFFVYRSAKQNGHNPWLWTWAALAVGIGLQLVIPFLLGIIIAVILMIKGQTPQQIQDSMQGVFTIIGIVFLVLSVVGIWLIMRKVNLVKENPSFIAPPSPPEF